MLFVPIITVPVGVVCDKILLESQLGGTENVSDFELGPTVSILYTEIYTG